MSRIYRVLFVSFLVLLSTQSIFAGRYYDSATGRWLSVDPLTDKFPGTSSYAYCFNNPLRNIDPDGKEPITLTITGVAVASVVTVAVVGHTYNYLTNPSYRMSYDSFTNSVINISSEAVANVWNTVSNWFSSDNSKNEGDVKEQSKEISKEIGKNSITLPDGTRVDLKGRGHTDKKTGEKVETPHTHEAKLHTNPKTGETFTKTKNTPRPTTQEDLDKIKEFIKKQNEER